MGYLVLIIKKKVNAKHKFFINKKLC